MDDEDRTASLMTPAKLAQVKPKATVSPAAWLDRMATDAGHTHLRRLAELRADLQLQATQRDFAALAADLTALGQSLPQLDFGLLQQNGLIARLSGKSKSAGAGFAAQYDEIEAAIDALAAHARTLQASQADQAGGTEKTLVEFEVEYRAIDKIIEQGTRWLQDMRTQLKTREAEAADEDAVRQVHEDAQRCELLVVRLKGLRALSTTAQETHRQAHDAASHRAALLQALQGAVAGRMRDWRGRLGTLAASAREGETRALSLDVPMECHRELQLAVKQAAADCAQVQSHEAALAGKLQAMGERLQAAG